MNGVISPASKAKQIGVTGPVEVGDAKTCIDGFTQGVAADDPSVNVENLDRLLLGRGQDDGSRQSTIAGGADVLTGSSQSVVGSIGAAKDAGNVLWFGTQSDQASLHPTWSSPRRCTIGFPAHQRSDCEQD